MSSVPDNSAAGEQKSPDRFFTGGLVLLAAFGWGLAEATWFFVVPDVLLTAIACRSLKAGFKATGAALIGAVLGGYFMFTLGQVAGDALRDSITQLPGIQPELIERVQSQLSQHGVTALLVGPTVGIPYKIYAIEWGARRGNPLSFLLVSIPARGIRFVLSVLLANVTARLLARWTKRRVKVEMAILGLVWVVFYTFYFLHFGW